MVHALEMLVAHYGLGMITLLIGLQCAGLLLPGETVMLATSVFAATTGEMHISQIIAAGVAGAVLGNVAGFIIGRRVGAPMLAAYGARWGLTPRRLVVGRYLFNQHGGKMVFFCRFLTVLRSFAPLLAGASGMRWQPFLGWTLVGGLIWPSVSCSVVFLVGATAMHLPWKLEIAFAALVVAGVVFGLRFLHQNEQKLEEAALRAEPPA